MTEFFTSVPEPVAPAGSDSDGLSFQVYDPDRMVLGKRMADHLRIGICYWHSFNWPGADIFGVGTFDRPWLAENTIKNAEWKQDVAFEFFTKLGTPFFSFHDFDMAPEGDTLAESKANLTHMVDRAGQKMEASGVKLLWGTANLFSHPRYMAGASTNPNPEVFAYAAAQVRNALDATKQLGGANYVLWGGREGYESLINTDLKREGDQLARFLHMVLEYKHQIGFEGTLLLEPKPQEPTKHQYDYDTATVYGFLVKHGLENDYKVNIEGNHATLGGHSFQHEVATAMAHGIFGSIDANRGDPQNGWDTDQFPNSVDEMSLVMYEIISGGGFDTGGFMFDTKLRRQSVARDDLFHGHIGGIDTLAQALLVTEKLIEDDQFNGARERRYSGWSSELGQAITAGIGLGELADRAEAEGLDPQPVSGRQELLENQVNAHIRSING